MNEMYDDPAIAAAFERFAEGYDRFYERPAVIELAGVGAGERVLDAGCGPGLYAAELAARGATVVGLDSSAPMLRRARERLGPGAGLVRATLDGPLPFATGAFDRVVCASALNYLADPSAFLGEARRVCHPRGAIVVSTRHPMTDWVEKGGSYFDERIEETDFVVPTMGRWRERFWRRPLSSLVDAARDAGLLVERLLEPLPTPEMAEAAPAHHAFLCTRPTFVVLRLVRRPTP